MTSGDKGDDQQQSLDALLSQSQQYSDFKNNKFSFANGFEDDVPSQEQGYSNHTPAKQHEMLMYSDSKADYAHDRNSSPYCSMDKSQMNSSTSFLDDKFSSSALDAEPLSAGLSRNSISNPQYRGSFSNDQQNGNNMRQQSISLKTEDVPPPELLFRQNDDALLSFTDDLSSSFGSSFQSDSLASSYGSSYSFQPQSLNGPSAVQSLSAHFSPSIKSPSSSLRAGSYLSTSLRNGSAGTPGMVSTPRTRHASISGNNAGEGLYSASVPKNVSGFSAEERLKRKREFHNAVERRRRELIKQKIKELGSIVPPSLLNYDTNGKQIKPNKGIILNKTVEYLDYLLQVLEIQERKKKQLLTKVDELLEKQTRLANPDKEVQQLSTTHKIPPVAEADGKAFLPVIKETVDDVNGFQGIDTDVSHERIIDTRAKPNQGTSMEPVSHWHESAIHNASSLMDNFLSESSGQFPAAADDLQQFLSGDLIEAEDNAKLLFNSGDHPDYLLEFDT